MSSLLAATAAIAAATEIEARVVEVDPAEATDQYLVTFNKGAKDGVRRGQPFVIVLQSRPSFSMMQGTVSRTSESQSQAVATSRHGDSLQPHGLVLIEGTPSAPAIQNETARVSDRPMPPPPAPASEPQPPGASRHVPTAATLMATLKSDIDAVRWTEVWALLDAIGVAFPNGRAWPAELHPALQEARQSYATYAMARAQLRLLRRPALPPKGARDPWPELARELQALPPSIETAQAMIAIAEEVRSVDPGLRDVLRVRASELCYEAIGHLTKAGDLAAATKGFAAARSLLAEYSNQLQWGAADALLATAWRAHFEARARALAIFGSAPAIDELQDEIARIAKVHPTCTLQQELSNQLKERRKRWIEFERIKVRLPKS